MQDLYTKQIELEDEYSTQSILDSQQQVLDAYAQGRAADIGRGRILVAKALESCLEPYNAMVNAKGRGNRNRGLVLLKEVKPEVAIMIGLRLIISYCADGVEHSMQRVLTEVGRTIEVESLISIMDKTSSTYTQRTVEYLDNAGTKSVNHRYRTLIAGADSLGLDWNRWSTQERIAVGKFICTIIYDNTGLFKWVRHNDIATLHIAPTEELSKYLTEAVESAKAVTRLPPMLIKPLDWTDQYNGGYYTDWCRAHAPMCSLRSLERDQRTWVLGGLKSDVAEPLRRAMNKAQSTAYRVNPQVLEILSTAITLRVGILGLPATAPKPKPEFPFPDEWLKSEATESELDQFKFWKELVRAWHTEEAKRTGRKISILSKLRELRRYENESELYFPTFIDWRGRVYFRSTLHPQLNDAVKGCLEFAEGKPLGEDGLYWLKVHVANSCGYDKHSPAIKAKWTEDNWEMICDFINNPLDVDAPEPDTAFTLLQAGLALQEALLSPNPEIYICHIPVAMDATCSGLQHLSALTRDTVGGTYTNLIDSSTDQKADIYAHAATKAEALREDYITDPVMLRYWEDKPITRKMAKKPCMTLVYGGTLLSTLDSVVLDMNDAGYDVIRDGSTILYSLGKLAVPTGKALRRAVQESVPKCTEMMDYIQKVNRAGKAQCMRWVSPVGVPVVNWAEKQAKQRIDIMSMGVFNINYMLGTGQYDVRRATNGIVPNFVHSMDAAHLCMTLNEFTGQVVPIHDSFGTHPCDVPELHRALRSTFVELYQQFNIKEFLEFNAVDTEEHPIPPQGDLDLEAVLTSRFMFC